MGGEGELFGVPHKKGDVVFRQGESGDAMYLIQSGAVEVSREREGGPVVVALLEKGDFFGEMVLLDDSPRSSTITAIAPTRLLTLAKKSLYERLKKDPAVILHILRAFCHRMEKTNALKRSAGEDSLEAADVGPAVRSGAKKPVGDGHRPDSPEGRGEGAFRHQEKRAFKPGETVFRKGEDGDSMYVILDGTVNIYDEQDGERFLLASLGPHDFFGEMSLIANAPRAATAVAAGPTRTVAIGKEDFLLRIAEDPDFGIYLLQVFARRLRRSLPGEKGGEQGRVVRTGRIPEVLRKEGSLKIAIVALSSCAGCSSVILEDREGVAELLERADVEYCPLLIDREEIGEVDIAIVEGVVRMKEDEEKLAEARAKSRLLVAWGTCATHGGIPAMANRFELEDLVEATYGETEDAFSYYLSGTRFRGERLLREQGRGLLRRAGRLDDQVRVDYYLSGCPPRTSQLIGFITAHGRKERGAKSPPLVCSECSRKPVRGKVDGLSPYPGPGAERGICFVSQGVFCLGLVTRGGCGAACTEGGLPCWGCRGPSDRSLKKIAAGEGFEQVVSRALERHTRCEREHVEELLKKVRRYSGSALEYFLPLACDRGRMI